MFQNHMLQDYNVVRCTFMREAVCYNEPWNVSIRSPVVSVLPRRGKAEVVVCLVETLVDSRPTPPSQAKLS